MTTLLHLKDYSNNDLIAMLDSTYTELKDENGNVIPGKTNAHKVKKRKEVYKIRLLVQHSSGVFSTICIPVTELLKILKEIRELQSVEIEDYIDV